jgi:nitrogen fixation protein NifU and related proteins
VISDLSDLYQEVIIDHSRKPRNFRRLADANRTAQGHNPLCGDRITVDLKLQQDQVADLGFQGVGCAICTASASLMTESVKGKTVEETERLFENFHDLITTDKPAAESLGKLAAFSGVREYPVRAKCATLAWHTLRADTPVSTE